MEITLEQLAQAIDGKIDGDKNAVVKQLCKIEEGVEGGLSFLANPKYTSYIYETKATAVIVKDDFVPEKELKTTLIRVADPYSSFAKLLELYSQSKNNKTGISPKAFIEESAVINEGCYIGEFASIGKNVRIGKNVKIYPSTYIDDNCVIGDDTIIFAGVKIYSDSKIGEKCRIHAGVVIGADGFGFAAQAGEEYLKVAQIGNVIIEDHVEIGANSTVDRATLGSTIIRKGVKIDNLCQVAHNVVIGENTVIAAQTGISGSTKLGNNCIIAGQVGFSGHLNIGNNVILGAQSGVTNHIKDNQTYLGSPAMDVHRMRKSYVITRNLPKVVERIDALEKKVDSCKKD